MRRTKQDHKEVWTYRIVCSGELGKDSPHYYHAYPYPTLERAEKSLRTHNDPSVHRSAYQRECLPWRLERRRQTGWESINQEIPVETAKEVEAPKRSLR